MNYIPMDVALQVAKMITVAVIALIAIAALDWNSNQKKKPPRFKGRNEL